MEEYENNSLHNCTDENELDSQPSPAEDFAAPQEDPTPEAEPCWTPDAKEEPQAEEQSEAATSYHNAGTGRKESPFADSPYVMGEPPQEKSRPTGDWETAYNHFKTPKQPKVKTVSYTHLVPAEQPPVLDVSAHPPHPHRASWPPDQGFPRASQ